jgi:hypothetical protein
MLGETCLYQVLVLEMMFFRMFHKMKYFFTFFLVNIAYCIPMPINGLNIAEAQAAHIAGTNGMPKISQTIIPHTIIETTKNPEKIKKVASKKLIAAVMGTSAVLTTALAVGSDQWNVKTNHAKPVM